ncbi:hypothetical protein H0H92_002809 [Tricholoma furcatifolium]|nr:hypothetical protein H0H92_002809 [Tricholoma furcatifolium]
MAPRTCVSEPATPVPRVLHARPDPQPQPPSKLCRTSEQVRLDNSAKEKAKKDKIEARMQMIQDVAHLKASLVEEDARMLAQAHNPPRSMQKKIPRTRSNANDAQPEPEATNAVINPALLENQSGSLDTAEKNMVLANSDDEDSLAPAHQVTASRYTSLNANVASSCNIDTDMPTRQEDNQHKRKASASSLASDQLSLIIIATLSSHYQWLDRLEISEQGEENPIGALVLTIQACCHHMMQWLTGSYVKPPGSLSSPEIIAKAVAEDQDESEGVPPTPEQVHPTVKRRPINSGLSSAAVLIKKRFHLCNQDTDSDQSSDCDSDAGLQRSGSAAGHGGAARAGSVSGSGSDNAEGDEE